MCIMFGRLYGGSLYLSAETLYDGDSSFLGAVLMWIWIVEGTARRI